MAHVHPHPPHTQCLVQKWVTWKWIWRPGVLVFDHKCMWWPAVHLKQDSTMKKAFLCVMNVTFCTGIEECRPGICSDNVIWVHTLRAWTSGHQCRHCWMSATHVTSFQVYLMGYKRHPMSLCWKPQSSLEVGGRGADGISLNMLDIQLTMAGFRLAASSPLAPPLIPF